MRNQGIRGRRGRNDWHQRAAEYHDLAAHAHQVAAAHHQGRGDFETGRDLSKQAMEYSTKAFRYAQEAKQKSASSASGTGNTPLTEPAKQARGTTNGNKKKK